MGADAFDDDLQRQARVVLQEARERVRAALLEALDEDLRPETWVLPRSNQLVAMLLEAAALRPRLNDLLDERIRVPDKRFHLLKKGDASEVAARHLLEVATWFGLEPQRESGDLLDDERAVQVVTASFSETCERYDALIAVLSSVPIDTRAALRVVLRLLVPELAIRRAARSHALGAKSVLPAPIVQARPFRFVVEDLLRRLRKKRLDVTGVPKSNRGFSKRAFDGWMSGKHVPQDDKLLGLTNVLYLLAEGRPGWTKHAIEGELRSGRIGFHLAPWLRAQLGEDAWGDLVAGFERQTLAAFECLRDADLGKHHLGGLLNADHRAESDEWQSRAAWFRPEAESLRAHRQLAEMFHGLFDDSLGVDPAGVAYDANAQRVQRYLAELAPESAERANDLVRRLTVEADPAAAEELRRQLAEIRKSPALLEAVLDLALLMAGGEAKSVTDARLRRDALVDLVGRGAMSSAGPWLCAQMTSRVVGPMEREDIHALGCGAWRERVLEWVALLVVLGDVANRAPALEEEFASVPERVRECVEAFLRFNRRVLH